MAPPPRTFTLTRLSRKPPAFRWLWNNHALVETVRAARLDEVWSTLAAMALEDGMAVSRNALRRAWPVVCDEWARAEPALRIPLDSGRRQRTAAPAGPQPVASAASGRIFSLTPDIPDDGFSLPDITGKKI